jgi:hypothetical protein
MVCGEVYRRLDPEFGFSVRARSMDMRSAFFPGKEKKPITLPFEYRRAHAAALPFSLSPRNLPESSYIVFVEDCKIIFTRFAGVCQSWKKWFEFNQPI